MRTARAGVERLCPGKDRMRLAVAGERSRGVVADHAPLIGVRNPGDPHRARDRPPGRPGSPAVNRRHEAEGELARRVGAVADREVVVANGEMGRAPGSRLVDRDPGQEMVDVAVCRVDRNSRHRRPRQPVERAAVDDVVRRAARPEPAVLPGDVDPAVPGDLRRREREGPHVAGDIVLAYAGDERAPTPGSASVGRADRVLRSAVCGERNDDVAVRLHDRLAAEPGGTARIADRPPGDPAVGRRDHLHGVALAVVVELDVAVAVVRARGPRVAGDPGLVPEGPRRLSGIDRVRPGQAAVARAVDEQDVPAPAGVDPEAQSQPDVVLRVIRDRRVADPRPRAAFPDRGSGQAAGRPRPACRPARWRRRDCSRRLRSRTCPIGSESRSCPRRR